MSLEIDHSTEIRKIDIGRRIVSFIGPEGSGKTTIAKRLASASNKPYVSTGDIIRDLAAYDQGSYGDACRAMFTEHRYLDSEMLLEIIGQRLAEPDTQEGFILDGGLRTVAEVKKFQTVLENADRLIPQVTIHLRIPGWMSFERLVTGNQARGRNDDTIEATLSRLSKYYDQLGERSSFIEKQKEWEFIHINATGSPNEIYRAVCTKLEI